MFNANNYGYNPYGRYVPQQPIQQPIAPMQDLSNRNTLNGKQVDSIDVVKATDIPLDGSISYFPLIDGSAIVTKQLQMNGTSKTVVYKPTEEENIESTKTITSEDLNRMFEELKAEITDLKQSLSENKKDE